MKRVSDDEYVVVLNFPFNLKIVNNIKEIVNPFSVIEWHCNITEYHDDHPHLHKHDELRHISFADNNFYDTQLYKEISKEIMFIPLRKGLRGLREIREII